jgi:hypothetical protein
MNSKAKQTALQLCFYFTRSKEFPQQKLPTFKDIHYLKPYHVPISSADCVSASSQLVV